MLLKFSEGTTYNGAWDGWYGSSELNWTYVYSDVVNSLAGKAVATVGITITPEKIQQIRAKATINCLQPAVKTACEALKAPCLFNIRNDPCEFNNEAER